MTVWQIGTMGYGYQDWLGVFYPHHARPSNYLQHYSKTFSAVEMDTTFYGIPAPDRVRTWANQTPEGFTFCPKTPREITHKGQIDRNIERMHEFIDAVGHFEERLGAVLIQFPPEFTAAEFDPTHAFLKALPATHPFAVEFRHRSWDTEDARSMLRDLGISWVSAEYVILPGRLHLTADFAYLRFLGRHGQFAKKNRIQQDVSGTLKRWWEDLRPELDRLRTVYAFFNNDFSGYSPATCNAFKELVGLEPTEPEIPTQGRLF